MNKIFVMGAMAATILGFSACNNDSDGPTYPNVPMTNDSLIQVLKDKGFKFNDKNQLLLDDKALKTDSLDLSRTKLKNFTGLDQLPNLRAVNLQNNDYKFSVDVSTLPSQVVDLDLRNNDIYEVKGLSNTTLVKDYGFGNCIIMHEFDQLYLPENVKYDQDQLVAFYARNKSDKKTVYINLADAKGKLTPYNTFRSVPDRKLRQYLYNHFSQVFTVTDNKDTLIDLSKTFSSDDQSSAPIAPTFQPSTFDGFQYIWNNPTYTGTTLMVNAGPNDQDIPDLKVNPQASVLKFNHVNFVNGLDLSQATNLYHLEMYSCKGVKTIDLSNSNLFGQRAYATETVGPDVSTIDVEGCDDIEEIKYPELATVVEVNRFVLLPHLKALDLSGLEFFGNLELGDLDACKIKYPTIQYSIVDGKIVNDGKLDNSLFGIYDDVYQKAETQPFIKANLKYLKQSSVTITDKYLKPKQKASVKWKDM
ncbi:hypothetical protein NG821_03515 [Prevotella cerevisiae]|uniref:Leucine-rich repeat domain-containing protein n=1 Tax=Segatella cerevisiae TaxID=2053716 RepID=A0ABT1BV04_9BACT|nr:hypothetical protein [Segatella cerevisiae]MCO6024922.1 hypothetical protein [Segatella cerevisiae]